MRLIAITICLFLCANVFAWNPIHNIDPSNTNDMISAGIDISYTKWRHVDSPTQRYWFDIVMDISGLPEKTTLDAIATLRREDDRNQWDVKVVGKQSGKNDNKVQLVFEVTEDFIENSDIWIQKEKISQGVRQGVGGYKLYLRDIVKVQALNTMYKKKNSDSGGNQAAQEFWLTNNATGEKCGPFDFREGARVVLSNQTYVIQKVLTDERVVLSNQTYVIQKVLTDEQKVIEEMKSIFIPKIDFQQADLHDVTDFLTHATREIEESRKADKAFDLSAFCITDPRPRPVSATDDPFAAAPATNDLPTITLHARFISLYDAVDIVAKTAGLTWSVQGKVVVFEKRKVQPATPPYSEPAARSPQR